MPTDALDGTVKAIADLATTILPFFQLAAGAGIASMAIVQLLKEALYLRAVYNLVRTRQWFRSHWEDPGLKAFEELILAVSGGSKFSVFGLSSPELAQKLKTGAEAAILDPNRYENLLVALTNRQCADQLLASNSPHLLNTAEGQNATAIAYLNIDALQASLGHWWKFMIRIVAITLSGGLIFYGLHQVNGDWDPVAYVLIAVVGGIVAPVAKDIISAIESLKKPTGT
jgi:hypothetical protein